MSFDQLDSKDECLRSVQWSNQLAKVEYYTDQHWRLNHEQRTRKTTA